jgi:hypothetical protein
MEAIARLQKSKEHRRHLLDDYERLYEKLAAASLPASSYELQQLDHLAGKIKCASQVLDAEIAMMNRCFVDLNRMKAKLNEGTRLPEERSPRLGDPKTTVTDIPRSGFR